MGVEGGVSGSGALEEMEKRVAKKSIGCLSCELEGLRYDAGGTASRMRTHPLLLYVHVRFDTLSPGAGWITGRNGKTEVE
jgi:hypothetical protein